MRLWPAEHRRRILQIESIVKLHALFGDTIRISDVQLIESMPLLGLFMQTEFCDFIKGEEGGEFLTLWARPTERLDLGTVALAVIASGLGRSLDDDWNSSSFEDPETVRVVAKAFQGLKSEVAAAELLRGRGNLARFLEEYRESDSDSLAGMLKALEYFLGRPSQVHVSEQKSTSYFDVLEEDREKLASEGTDVAELDDVLRFVINDVAKDLRKKRYLRTPAILELENRGLESPENRRRYHTVVQAWNIGVSNTVNADYDSVATFRDVDTLPLLHGNVTELSIPATVSVSDVEIFESLPLLRTDWSPATISWSTIKEVRRECSKQIMEFQDSRSAADNTEQFGSLIAAISAVVSRRGEGVPLLERTDILPALMSLGSELGGKVVAMTQRPRVQPWVEFASGVAESLSGVPGVSQIPKVLSGVSGGFAYGATRDAIRRYALRYNIRRTPRHLTPTDTKGLAGNTRA
jgi:hypothetical protein